MKEPLNRRRSGAGISRIMIDSITNESLNVRLVIGDEGLLTEPLQNYESWATTDEQFLNIETFRRHLFTGSIIMTASR